MAKTSSVPFAVTNTTWIGQFWRQTSANWPPFGLKLPGFENDRSGRDWTRRPPLVLFRSIYSYVLPACADVGSCRRRRRRRHYNIMRPQIMRFRWSNLLIGIHFGQCLCSLASNRTGGNQVVVVIVVILFETAASESDPLVCLLAAHWAEQLQADWNLCAAAAAVATVEDALKVALNFKLCIISNQVNCLT